MVKIKAARFVADKGRSILFVGGITGKEEEGKGALDRVVAWCVTEGVGTLVMFFGEAKAEYWNSWIKKKERDIDLWTICSMGNNYPLLFRGSGNKYAKVSLPRHYALDKIFTYLTEKLGEFVKKEENSLICAISPEKIDKFIEMLGGALDHALLERYNFVVLGRKSEKLALIKMIGLHKFIVGRHRAICTILINVFGEVKGSELAGVVRYWELIFSRKASEVEDMLNNTEAVRLDGVLGTVVRWDAAGGEDGNDKKGKGLERRNPGVTETATTMARMGLKESGAGTEFVEEKHPEGGNEEDGSEADVEEVGWVGKASGRPRFCLLRFDGTDPGLPSEKMMDFIRQEQECKAVVVLGFRTMEGLKEEVKNAWFGIKDVIVVEWGDGRLYFGGECREFQGNLGDVLFFGNDCLIEWIVGEVCGFLGKSESVRDRWIASILKFMGKIDWLIEGFELWAYVRFGAGAPGEERDVDVEEFEGGEMVYARVSNLC